MRNISGPFAATSKMANLGRSGAKTAFSASPFWRYVFCGFREVRSIFKNPFFAKSRLATQKHKNEDGRGRRNIFCYFLKTPILSFVWPLQDWKRENPIFPAVLAIFTFSCKMPASHLLEPRRRLRR